MSLSEAEIAELVKRHPLPDGVNDAVMNQTELAAFFGVTLTTISVWLNAGMPVLERGRQGSEYEMQASACWAWKQARDASEVARSREAQDAIEAMRLALVGGTPGDSLEALDPKQRREIIAAQMEQERFQVHRGELMRRTDVRQLVENLLRIFMDTVDAWPDRLERSSAFPPALIEKHVEEGDALVEELRRQVQAYWTINPLRERAREGLFDEA